VAYTAEMLDDVRRHLAPDDSVLEGTRDCRDAAKSTANTQEALRANSFGSWAPGLTNCPNYQRAGVVAVPDPAVPCWLVGGASDHQTVLSAGWRDYAWEGWFGGSMYAGSRGAS
jgi:hypothetical protein